MARAIARPYGTGLNLSIKRIIFQTLKKFDGNGIRFLYPPEVKQIAGRAGRYGMGSAEGGVTTLDPDHLPMLREVGPRRYRSPRHRMPCNS